jgi:glyoxylase-like metal-dependent hydrolase (beta-lactamase superfamily II)
MTEVPQQQIGAVTVFFGDRNGKYPDGNQVVVAGSDLRVAFDTPLVANRIGPALDGVDTVILGHMHEDHMAGLHRLPRAAVWVHEADVEAARSWAGLARHYGYPGDTSERLRAMIEAKFHYHPRPDAQPYADGARWDLGGGISVTAIHLPGHTSGHCALLVEPAGVAFIGDIDLTGFGPYYGDATSSLAAFRRSLEAVKAIPARAWVTSHHRGVVSDRAIFLDLLAAFTARIDERAERLLQMLDDGPSTLEALVQRRLTYPVGYDELWVNDAERRTIAQHLTSWWPKGGRAGWTTGASRGPDRSTQYPQRGFSPEIQVRMACSQRPAVTNCY